MKNIKQDGQCYGQDLNQAPPPYKSEATWANILGKILVLFVQFSSVLLFESKCMKNVLLYVCVQKEAYFLVYFMSIKLYNRDRQHNYEGIHTDSTQRILH
jgi:hypothetical protein